MITANIEFDQKTVRDMNQRMHRMQDLTGRSARAVVYATTKEFGFAAVKATANAKAQENRTALAVGPKKKRGKKDQVLVIARIRRNGVGDPKPTPVSLKTAKAWGMRHSIRRGWTLSQFHGVMERVWGRGFGRACWLAAMRHATVPISRTTTPIAMAYSEGYNGLNDGMPNMMLANKAPHIGKLDSGGPGLPPGNIMQQALHMAMAKMDERMQALAQKYVEEFRR